MKPHAYIYDNATQALPHLLDELLQSGAEQESRNGLMKELTAVQVTLTSPWERYQYAPSRKASLPAQIAETAWVLSGRNDVEWLTHYLPQAQRFSDDGETWRGGYGPRLRSWGDGPRSIDQLEHVVDVLRRDPDSRRAILSIYNPTLDARDGLDIPCNQYVQLMIRDGALHMFVSIRSNDLMWGWSGINTFEWSVLQQAVSEILGVDMGPVTYSIASLHLYERHWDKAARIVMEYAQQDETQAVAVDQARVFADSIEPSVDALDTILSDFFNAEHCIRNGLGVFLRPDSPLFDLWLSALSGWWHDGNAGKYLESTADGEPTNILLSAYDSPINPVFRKGPQRTKPSVIEDRARQDRDRSMSRHPAGKGMGYGVPEDDTHRQFAQEVGKLHYDKNEAYGDSWKRRGEMLGIMANIARKVDRLGADGGGDTATDTAVDLLVYLIKYDLWIMEETGDVRHYLPGDHPSVPGDYLSDGPNHTWYVNRYLDYLADSIRFDNTPAQPGRVRLLEDAIRASFETLEQRVTSHDNAKSDTVEFLIVLSWRLAGHLWLEDQAEQDHKREQWKAGNATRRWAGYEDVDEDVVGDDA